MTEPAPDTTAAAADETESPIEEVRLTVPNTDDPSLPVWTFRMWFIGLVSCAAMSFINQFFAYRSEPLTVSVITVQIASLPVGHFLARVLPAKKFRLFGRECSLNPGPFNMKEHVLISIFAQSGYAFGNGSAYAVGIVNIIKAFYHRNISFWAGLILIITTQVLGYGWAGILRKYVIEPAHMWWPGTLVQVSLFRALHEKDKSKRRGLSREKFFLIALICSFCWALVPGYLFATISSISVLCYIFPKSVTLQQIGSGQSGLSIGAFTFDWNMVVAFLGSPLPVPFFAIANVLVGYLLIVYAIAPVLYWGFNLYNAKNFPLISAHLFSADGNIYDTSAIVNSQFELDIPTYQKLGKVNLSMFFAISYGLGFANIASTVTHVALFYGREIYNRFRNAVKGKEDVHTRLMRKYEDIPNWWFHVTLVLTIIVSLLLCIFMNDQVQLPWWGLIAACVLAFVFTLPVAIITATTNQTPGLNIITEYLMGLALPGKPIANVCFKVYGYMSMAQAISFLNDFKLGHYMKIPPKSMFVVQFVGTILAGTINLITAWWLLTSIEHICEPDKLPSNSPWTCPNDNVFFSASVIWGLVGPRRIFGPEGLYSAQNWFFLGGLLGPVVVWLFHKAFPKQKWIPLINLPVLLGASAYIPPASALNYNSWVIIGIIFNYYIFKYKKNWWQKYNYVLSAALDAGVAFMAVLLFLSVNMQDKSLSWWGQDEHCPLATCPTAKGIKVDDCPVF